MVRFRALGTLHHTYWVVIDVCIVESIKLEIMFNCLPFKYIQAVVD